MDIDVLLHPSMARHGSRKVPRGAMMQIQCYGYPMVWQTFSSLSAVLQESALQRFYIPVLALSVKEIQIRSMLQVVYQFPNVPNVVSATAFLHHLQSHQSWTLDY